MQCTDMGIVLALTCFVNKYQVLFMPVFLLSNSLHKESHQGAAGKGNKDKKNGEGVNRCWRAIGERGARLSDGVSKKKKKKTVGALYKKKKESLIDYGRQNYFDILKRA